MKKILKYIVITSLILATICLYYASKIEPFKLRKKEYDIDLHKNTAIKIVHLSDIHIKENYNEEILDKIIDMTNLENPDLVIFTGDLFDNYGKYGDHHTVGEKLSKIKSKYGKFAVYGNHDYGGNAKEAYKKTMKLGGFNLLVNQVENLEIANKKISIGGVDDNLFGNPDIIGVDKKLSGDIKILLSHEGDPTENVGNTDLVLSGHTHGGQVRLPFIKKYPNQGKKYIKGLYELSNSNIFVSSGIGTSILTLRFLVEPEISVLNIK